MRRGGAGAWGQDRAGSGPAPAQGSWSGLRRPPGGNLLAATARAGSGACSSLAHSLALGSCHRSAGTAQGSPRAGEPASRGGREQTGGNEGAPWLSLCPAALLPALPAATGPPRVLLTLGKLGTARGQSVAPQGRPGPLAEREEEEEEKEVSPKDPLRAVCPAVSVRTQSSTARRGPIRGWLAGGTNFQLFSQLAFSRHPGVSSGQPGGRAPASRPRPGRPGGPRA